MPLSSRIAKGFGIHQNIVFVHASTLEEAEFKLKLGTTVSNISYKHCTKFPIYGSGQGSSSSPTIWVFISTKLFNCFDQHAYGMQFQSPTGDINFRLTVIGFVDDTTTITALQPGSSLSDLLDKTQHDAQLWNDILFTSGSRLELSKCGYHTVFYDFLDSGIPVL